MSINWFIIVGIIVLFLGIVAIEKYGQILEKLKQNIIQVTDFKIENSSRIYLVFHLKVKFLKSR